MKKTKLTTLLISTIIILTGCKNPSDNSSSSKPDDIDDSSLISETSELSDLDYLLEMINGNEVKDDIAYLSSPELDGRSPGTIGNDKAIEFIANRFEELGLEHFKDESYLQPYVQEHTKIPVSYPVVYTYKEGSDNRHYYKYCQDYTFVPYRSSLSINKEIELQFDLEVPNANATFFTSENNMYYTRFESDANIFGVTSDLYFPSLEYGQGEYFSNDITGVRLLISESMKNSLQADFAENMRKMHVSWEYENGEKEINNVVGILRGENVKDDKHIIISCHLDHVGRFGEGEDEYFPGALDNASGTAGMLHLAKILSTVKDKLTKHVVFVAKNGEEGGLYGSNNYIYDPAIKIEKNLRLLLNLDMIGSDLDNEAPMEIIGNISKTSQNNISEYAKKYGLTNYSFSGNSPDSDHYAVARLGINSFTFCHYDNRFYHRPTDTVDHISEKVLEKHLLIALSYLSHSLL